MLNLPVRLNTPCRRFVAVAASLLALSACGENRLEASVQTGLRTVDAISEERSFNQWRDAFRDQALAAGIEPKLFDRAFQEIEPDPAVLKADGSQPEFARPVWEYLDGALSTQRQATGRIMLARHAGVLQQIEERYGVDRHILVAIWGLESNFGSNMGNRSVIRSLATLAHQGRRSNFAQTQLLAALEILQRGDTTVDDMTGSWAGAMGQTQFIPTTYNDHAVDFDGNGKRDIWHTEADALASAANYLRTSNWKTGTPWGTEVRLADGFDYALADMSIRKPLTEWSALGVTDALGRPLAANGDTDATLILPAGHRGPAFLIMNNFRSILRYNNSTSYALAISLLAERFQGQGQIYANWPTEDKPLSRTERLELQERLETHGYEPGSVDGIIGANTRQAIRRLQIALGWPADGYPDQQLLKALRQQTN
ncbi:membrane-bound lytic murein transglycosylase B [Halopseudomonas litoralis]|uniref:Membrane-bound lytic murein transglycosylase B n=1 Tax=Halopseudomonas litoralis TaxID=797277 RepID=A0A1H1TH85_9GAMM|nr:lytic murein transglycosylase [Halopseudomonas litoralis]SDS59568.1 membrane-bound lytic murein transglycosylase B [Halopseudomonas litoralis]